MDTAPGGLPGKQKKTKGGRYSHEITLEEVEQYYSLPCEEASRQLGIGLTILKRICRRLGIKKWPYRQLKRQGKLGDVPPPNSLPISPFDTATHEGEGGGSAAHPQQEPRPQRQQKAGRGGAGNAHAHRSSPSTSGSGGSWDAQRRTAAAAADWLPDGLPAARGLLGSDPLAPLAPPAGGPPLAPPAGGRHQQQPAAAAAPARRRSQQHGDARPRRGVEGDALLVRAGSAQHSGSTSGGPDGGSAGSSGLQRAHSAALKRAREDSLFNLLGLGSDGGEQPSPNPFSEAAHEAAPLPAVEASAERLASGMSRLAMRTLSLRRRCSRDGATLDSLDRALLQERAGAARSLHGAGDPGGMARAYSMPAANGRRPAPPAGRRQQQQGQQQGQQQQQGQGHVVQGVPNFAAQQHHSWLAQEQLHLQRQQGLPPLHAAALGFGFGGLHNIEEPLDGDTSAISTEPDLSAMFGQLPAPLPKRHSSGSDPFSDGCLLLEGAGEGTLGLDASDVHKWQQQQQQQQAAAASAAAVTRVGPGAAPNASAPASAKQPADVDAGGNMLSPFSMKTSTAPEDNEVDDLLADFLNPSSSDLAQLLKMDDLLSPFSGAGDEELPPLRSPASTLPPVGLAAGVPPPPQAQQQQQQQSQLNQQQNQQYAHAQQQQHQQLQQQSPGGSHGEGCGAGGSGSVISHDTPTSSGTCAMAAPSVLDMPLSPLSHISPVADVVQLAASLVNDPDPVKQLLANQLLAMQQFQHQQQLQQAMQQQAMQQQQQLQQAMQQQAMEKKQHAVQVQAVQQQAVQQQLQQQLQQQQQVQLRQEEEAALLHLKAQEQYLQQRQEVRAMLQHRGGASYQPQLGGADDRLRLQQLTRLKQLKLQLAAAQARQAELQRVREEQARMAQQAPSLLQQEEAAWARQSPVSDVSSAFYSGAPRLGPPPPLPVITGPLPSSGAGQRYRPPMQPAWGALCQAQMQGAQAAQQGSLAQRAASSPLPWDLDWMPRL